jgi:Xaa-Pro aminopeptidase
VALGDPTNEQRKNFTLVLKGHIGIASAEFNEETTGADIDYLARQYLNAEGLDYDHGTGHGVGSYLSVHEGPQGISKKSKQRFYPGMVVSNEPGYYKEGEYGIRIESLLLVIEKGEKLGFETITMAPIDINLIDSSLLTAKEKDWLNEYHSIVREKISSLLDDETKDWLKEKTRPLG